MSTEVEFKNGSTLKLLLKYSIPTVLILILSSFYNFIDQIFIGNSYVGDLGNSAIGVTYVCQVIALAFSWYFGDGCAAYLSLKQGQGDTSDCHKTIGSSISILFAISIVLMVMFITLSSPLLTFLGANDDTLQLAKDYLIPLSISFPFYMIQNMLCCVIRSDGSPYFALLSTGIGTILNIILDPLFIFAFKLGMLGCSIATMISIIASFFVTIAYLFKSKTFKLTFKSLIPNFKNIIPVLKLGISSLMAQLTVVVITIITNRIIVSYGPDSKYLINGPLAIIANESKIFSIILNIAMGISLGAQPIISYNYGSKNYERVKKTFYLALLIVFSISIVFTILIEANPLMFLYMFGKGNQPTAEIYEEYGIHVFRIYLSTISLTSIIKLTSFYFQSCGKPIKSLISSLSRDLIFILFMVILPSISKQNGGSPMISFLYSVIIADTLGILISGGLFIKNQSEINKLASNSKNL